MSKEAPQNNNAQTKNPISLDLIKSEAESIVSCLTTRAKNLHNEVIEFIITKVHRAQSTGEFFILLCFLCSILSVIQITCNGITLAISIGVFAIIVQELNKKYPVNSLTAVFVWGIVVLTGVLAITYTYIVTFWVGFLVGPTVSLFEFVYCFFITYVYHQQSSKGDEKKEK